MKNIYLASRYSRKDDMRIFAKELNDLGYNVTSRWLQEEFYGNMSLEGSPDVDWRKYAEIDLEDIDFADTFIFFAEDQNNQPPRGGRHVEFGYALYGGIDLIVIGEKENLFHYIPRVTHFATWSDFLNKARGNV